MKTTQAWGWLAAGVLALGVNGFYQDGGVAWVHRVVDQVAERSGLMADRASERIQLAAERVSLVAARNETASCRLATAVARVQTRFAQTRFAQTRLAQTRIARSEGGIAQLEAMSAREEARVARVEANRARIEAEVARMRVAPVAFDTVKIPEECPRVRINMPRVNVPRPVVKIPTVHSDGERRASLGCSSWKGGRGLGTASAFFVWGDSAGLRPGRTAEAAVSTWSVATCTVMMPNAIPAVQNFNILSVSNREIKL